MYFFIILQSEISLLNEEPSNIDFIFVTFDTFHFLVCDNFNSTFTEALIYNIPTILFFDPQLYPLNGSFQKLFQRMNKAGIIHIDPLSAANHIEKIGDNPLAWWNSLEIIELRDEFLSLYGDSENDPLGVLVIKLKSLLNTVNLRVKFSK